jgi:glutaredoxin 3
MIKIYSTPVCGLCRRAKALLTQLGIEFMEYNVYEDSEAMAVMREMKFHTVPQISIDDVWVGGYTELVEMQEAGALDNLKDSTAITEG